MSTTELAQRGFVGDALTVARTIVELAIDLGYIESDPGTLVRRFRDYADVRNREMAEAINELYGGTVAPAVMQVLRDRAEAYIGNEPNSEYSWAAVGRERRGVGWRAEKVAGSEQRRSDYRRMYSLLYSEMCGASHSGTITLEYTMTNGVIQFGPQAPSARPIRLAARTSTQCAPADTAGIWWCPPARRSPPRGTSRHPGGAPETPLECPCRCRLNVLAA